MDFEYKNKNDIQGATHNEFMFKLYDEHIYGQSWSPKKIEAVLVVTHGMGEHGGRYGGHFANAFIKKNIAVLTFDLFGHGKTTGKRGDTPGFKETLDSIDEMLDICKSQFGNVPTFLYGHSLGGTIVANYVLRRQSDITGAIISSAMLRLAFDPPAWKMKVGNWLRNVYPKFTENTGLEVEAISRDKKEVEKYKKDPLIHDKITINYSLPFFEAGEWAIKNAGILTKPVFVFHGTKDRLTDYKGSVDYAQIAGKKAMLKLYEGGYHELHNDLCKDEVLDDITNWIESFLYTSFRL